MPVWWKESLGSRERFGEDGKENALVPAQDGKTGEQQRVSVERAMSDAQTRHSHEITKQAEGNEDATGDQKKPTRTTH